MEFLALIMNARRESTGREPAAKPRGAGRDGGRAFAVLWWLCEA